MRTYLQSEKHTSWNFNIHFSLLKNLIILVSACLTDVDNSPGESVFETLYGLEVDIECYWRVEISFRLFDNHIENVLAMQLAYLYSWASGVR